jgi:hypothetical protein
MVRNNLNTHIYAVALLLSMFIFATGVYVGHLIDSNNLNSISEHVANTSNRITSLQLLLLTGSNSTSFCPVYQSELEDLNNEIENIGYQLTFLEEEKQVYDDELKRNYFVLEGESYLLSQKVKATCNDSTVLLIHFYSNANCGQLCKDQGTAVMQARDELAGEIEMRLFSFDGELDSPVAEAFEAEYNVTGYPTLVINGQTYSGFQSVEQIKSIIRASQ